MATQPNWVLVPCLVGIAKTPTNEVNAASVLRTPTPLPLGVVATSGGGGGSTNTGPQRWPV